MPAYIWLALKRTSEFKFSFYSYIFLYGTQMAFYLAFWSMVEPPSSLGWSTEACYLLTGFGMLCGALQELVWSTGIIDLMILRGELTLVLVRPESSYFGLVLRKLGIMALLPAFMGLGLIVVTLVLYYDWHLLNLFMALVCCTLASVTLRAMMLAVNTLGFRYGKVNSLKSALLGTRELARYPIDILPAWSTGLLCTLFPVLMISNWPASLLIRWDLMTGALVLALVLLVTVAWVGFTAWMWKRGLRHYEGLSL